MIDQAETAAIVDQLFNPAPAETPGDTERGGGAQQVANQHDQKAPPQAEQEPATDAENAARQEQYITDGISDRIDDTAPKSQAFNVFSGIANPV